MKKKIGLFGCMVNNDNLGCCALTYSLINSIEQQSKDYNIEVTYVIFERNPDKNKVEKLSEALGIEKDRVISEKAARFIRFYESEANRNCKNQIAKCDVVIDLTQGDSFTDIYGINRFVSYTLDKLVVEGLNIPLILGPQTYGPYRTKIAGCVAKKAIKHADYVMSRDLLSKKYLDTLKIDKEVHVGTDLAIGLPYQQQKKINKSVGINISGLLWPNKIEGTETKFLLKCDYKKFMEVTVQMFANKGYKVYFISHVGADYPACCEMKKIFPTATLVEPFSTPVEAKSLISSLEVFVGARMHATIAAFSSNVPVIPIAYSRKFKGLFENCQYDIGIDLTELDTNQSLTLMMQYIDDIEAVQLKVTNSRSIAYSKYNEMTDSLCKAIFKRGN
jgi:colanic acid/amylovoran biosynthesis protein